MQPRDQAWTAPEPHWGCSHLVCGQCGREVRSFEEKLLGQRPEPDRWLHLYDAGELESVLVGSPKRFPFRLYVCGCRAFACADPREVDLLAIEDDLPWACAGHPR